MPNTLSATQAAKAIREGSLRSETLVQACLARISAREPAVGAFAFIDEQTALAQARACDKRQAAGEALGPLHGLPVAVKDVIDTFDMPTQYGSPIFTGRQPEKDATAVAKLREAGAVILGKTVTSELATPTAGPTRNPLNLLHTPGGSSSGSAAAVADNMVPLALGTQTKGSIVRPASYCGVIGYKPTHGLVGRTGSLHQSWLLDHIGVFARNLADTALVAQAIMGYDAEDPYTKTLCPPDLGFAATQGLGRPPRLLFVKGSPWKWCRNGAESTLAALLERVQATGAAVQESPLPASIDKALDWIDTMLGGEWANCFGPLYNDTQELLSPALCALIEKGFTVPAHAYVAASDQVPLVAQRIEALLSGYDAIITLPAGGEAELLTEKTSGNPVFCSIWTFAGVPAISLPLGQGPAGLPLGVQLIAPKGQDARLFAVAAWMSEALGAR